MKLIKSRESGGCPVLSASLFSLVEEHELCVLPRPRLLQSANQCSSSDLSKVTVNYMYVISGRTALYVKKMCCVGEMVINGPSYAFRVHYSDRSTQYNFGCTLPPPPNPWPNFLYLHAVFRKIWPNNRLALRHLCPPPPRKSCIRPCIELNTLTLNFHQCILFSLRCHSKLIANKNWQPS